MNTKILSTLASRTLHSAKNIHQIFPATTCSVVNRQTERQTDKCG